MIKLLLKWVFTEIPKGIQMKNLFTQHPHSMGESYFQHFKFAFLFGMSFILGGLACLIHAFFPCFFQQTGSNFLIKMLHHFIDRSPLIEDRIIQLTHTIEMKLKQSK